MKIIHRAGVGAACAAALVLAGCGRDDDGGASAPVTSAARPDASVSSGASGQVAVPAGAAIVTVDPSLPSAEKAFAKSESAADAAAPKAGVLPPTATIGQRGEIGSGRTGSADSLPGGSTRAEVIPGIRADEPAKPGVLSDTAQTVLDAVRDDGGEARRSTAPTAVGDGMAAQRTEVAPGTPASMTAQGDASSAQPPRGDSMATSSTKPAESGAAALPASGSTATPGANAASAQPQTMRDASTGALIVPVVPVVTVKPIEQQASDRSDAAASAGGSGSTVTSGGTAPKARDGADDARSSSMAGSNQATDALSKREERNQMPLPGQTNNFSAPQTGSSLPDGKAAAGGQTAGERPAEPAKPR